MKITQLFKIYWPDNGGGIAKVMESIADGCEGCVQEMIVCQDSRKKKSSEDSYKNIAVYRCSQLFEFASTPVSPRFLFEVKRRSKDSDIVIYHFPYPMADLAVLLGMYSGRLVVWWHCGFEKYQKLGFLYQPLVRHTLRKADCILVSSRGNLEHSDVLKRFLKKCRVVPFCVSEEYLQRGQAHAAAFQQQDPGTVGQAPESGEEGQQRADRRRKQLCILFIGRLVWYKGCDVLLHAFARMKHKGCRLVLVGSGPLEQELKRLAASLQLKNVRFAGRVSEEDKMRQIEACDFLVLPSVSEAEAFAVVQLEAMAFGKPVINTRLKSGVPYVSVDGVTGITVKPGSVRELAQAMEELAADEKLRRKYGANALRIVQKEYTLEKMAKRYRKVFRELLEEQDRGMPKSGERKRRKGMLAVEGKEDEDCI
ncbi:MAG: glycosyltransferase [Eubacterium sp.]|nr:glycosyltransferase [Eubacterium sp.]